MVPAEREPISAEVADQVASLRADVLEAVARLEVYLDQSLSTYLAADERAQQHLYREIVWRTPLDRRLHVLKELLEDDDWADDYAFLPHFDDLVDTRHVLAHMILDPFRSSDEMLRFVGRRSGDDRERDLSVARLRGLARVADGVCGDLWRLLDRLLNQRGVEAPTPAPPRPAQEE